MKVGLLLAVMGWVWTGSLKACHFLGQEGGAQEEGCQKCFSVLWTSPLPDHLSPLWSWIPRAYPTLEEFWLDMTFFSRLSGGEGHLLKSQKVTCDFVLTWGEQGAGDDFQMLTQRLG